MPSIDVQLRPAWRNYWAGLTLALLLLLASLASVVMEWVAESVVVAGVLLVLALLTLGVVVFKRFSWKFTIEGNRVSRHQGIISRNQQSIRINDLRSVELDQSIFQRIFGVGDLLFYSSGSDHAEVKFFGIKDPVGWRDNIYNAMDEFKASSD
ncbi:PH domain-containing protein [Wenzhouxiangella sp. XN201]|uniref:PH domain-containing protein n=1 Tax=Wenzhouxiangella sp. XN201 TaxID=2710755 RepID=UPI0013C68F9A|nr:PH domain-containing protein [Wenzhouxiangella sp. XN201]NEZ03117.1 PH domain-containing protein [Wenzhouxiangella sp. XN201]